MNGKIERVKLTCCRCGARRSFPVSDGIDVSTLFLCDRCDSDFVIWCNSRTRNKSYTDAELLSRFLELCPLGT